MQAENKHGILSPEKISAIIGGRFHGESNLRLYAHCFECETKDHAVNIELIRNNWSNSIVNIDKFIAYIPK